MIRNLEKHQKYKSMYRPNELYWGLGVEHETYIETSKLKQVALKELKENKAAERYSVNYYSVYNEELLHKTLDGLFEPNKPILIPILINSHTFQKTDINGEHQTTQERVPKPNPKFSGKTLFELMKELNPNMFAANYEKSYIFDGDTVEFMTQNFYKAKLKDVINELISVETLFIDALNSLPIEGILKTYGPLQIAQENYPFATYLTNIKNNAMFNNGTIHINITLPTKLNENNEIEDFTLFRKQHQNYARAIQWLSPFLIARYGSSDPLSESKINGTKYSAGSQRVAVSRYIGLGTYDTDKMEVGKILTKKRTELEDIDWYESFHKKVDYVFLDNLGMDINFNKHYSHGIEFRILESVPINDLEHILKIMIYLADFSLNNEVENPKKSQLWHKIAENCVHDGKGYHMEAVDQNEIFRIFNISYASKEPLYVSQVLDIIVKNLINMYDDDGICVNYMIKDKKEEIKVKIEDKKEEIIKLEECIQLESVPQVKNRNPICCY